MSAIDTALIRGGRLPGTLSWLIAATCLLMLLAVAAALALGGTARVLAGAEHGRLIVQIVDADPRRRDAAAADALRVLRGADDIDAVRARTPAETARLLRPYLGDAALADLPMPILIEATLGVDADRARIARLLAAIPTAHVDPAAGLAPLTRLVASLRGLAVAVAIVAGGAAALVAALAARAALAGHEQTVGVLHALGATDRQLARLLGRRMLRDALAGVAIGFVVGALAIRLLGAKMAAVGSGLGVAAALGWGDWLVLALLPLAIAGLAVAVVQGALLALLARAP